MEALRLLMRKRLGMLGGSILMLLVVAALCADFIAPFPPNEMNLSERLQDPSARHPLGTDNYGRDLFSRVIYGGRVSLFVGLATVAISTSTATLLGMISGYFGGTVDLVLQRIVDALLSIPRLVFLLAVMSVIGGGLANVVFALALRSAATSVRVMRGAVIGVKGEPYLEGARAVGCSSARILRRYILPNVFATVIVVASIELGMAILSESAMSFLGFGVSPPTATWGSMLSGENLRIMTLAPWTVVAPGLALSLAVFGINVFADALRDVLDPKLRGFRGGG